ncbi:hypothetical protein [Mycoplasma sp. CSL7503-lung]|uniref:hypothetical protein n=1 Tax=Mycoplasma sp. CSL7503-lung TaxID=536372 RepID=UPI0021D0C551|nr:hypothetical protein [Mycoplasma sp. CSL7503-lung]
MNLKNETSVLSNGKYKIIFNQNNPNIIKKNRKSEVILDGIFEKCWKPFKF